MSDATDRLAVLLVEDNPGDARLVEHHLDREVPQALDAETELTHVESLSAAQEALATGEYDLLILDLGLPECSGTETLDRLTDVIRETPTIVLTGLDDTATAVEAIQQGAQDYLPKDDLDTDRLWRSIRYAIERKRQEQQLRRRTEQLELLNSILRHDLKNGMEVISRNADLLAADLDGERRERAATIIDWSENVTDLTARIQGMIRAVTSDGDRDLRSVELAPIIESQAETVEGMPADVTVELDVPFGTTVAADEMLEEVLHNLLTNTVEHNDSEAVRITVDVTVGEETVEVAIADNGPGIPEAERDRLFGRGESGPRSDGDGFGLYFVRTMVESYGGSITVEDNEPRGTVVTLELPASTAG
jgi:signal transduction histidine kinase